ncbi:MAG: hypothetical protein RL329_1541 [Bacteroidota bacterium]
MKLLICIALIISQSSGCTSVSVDAKKEPPKTEIWHIKHHKTIAQGESAQWCYLVRKSETADWTFFYAPIEKLDYEWGHHYIVKIKQTQIKKPAADGSSIRFEVVQIVSDKPVAAGTTFEIPLTDAAGRAFLDAPNHKILNSIIYITDSKIEEKTRQIVAAGELKKGIFQHGAKGALILKDVQ